jgi:hypothetical protein
MGRIAAWMAAVFVLTGLVSSVVLIGAVKTFHPAEELTWN